MARTVAELTRILGMTREEVKALAWQFRKRLSASANPPKGEAREFSDEGDYPAGLGSVFKSRSRL